MEKEVRWERMFPDQLEEAFSECPVVYFAYGLCEPHGPQNAIGLDCLKAHAIVCAVARKRGGIVAPADFWHVHEVGGMGLWGHKRIGEIPRKWLTAVPPSVHFKNVCYQVRTADVTGFQAAILLTGHYGPNWEDLKLLVEKLQPYVGTRLYSLPDFEANNPGFDENCSGGDHAGRVETSLMMALDPACSDLTRLPPRVEDAADFGGPWAMMQTAYDSDRRTGERMVSDEVNYISAKVDDLFREYRELEPEHSFRTFAEVENFWAKEIMPILPDFKCLEKDYRHEDRDIPGDSVWYENRLDPNVPTARKISVT